MKALTPEFDRKSYWDLFEKEVKAEKHIKPPELTEVIVSHSQTQMKPGEKQTLTAWVG